MFVLDQNGNFIMDATWAIVSLFGLVSTVVLATWGIARRVLAPQTQMLQRIESDVVDIRERVVRLEAKQNGR